METMEAHVGEMETQLLRWGARLNEVEATADVAAAAAQLDYHLRVDDLRAKYRAAQTELDELKAAESSEEWETIQAGIERTWSELEPAFKKLAG